MADTAADEDQAKHDPLAALRQRSFLAYSSSRIFASLAQSMVQAVMAYQVYDITGSAVSLGLLGVARFIPALFASLIGGAVADGYDRRKLMIGVQVVPLSCGLTLAISSASGWVSTELIYGLAIAFGLASAFEAPARTALLPAIVRPETFANAVTVNNVFQKFGQVSGPVLGGFLIAGPGYETAYSVYAVALCSAVVPLFFVRYHGTLQRRQRPSLAAVKEGIAFVRAHQVLLGAMSIDMFAVIFGGAQALLPIYSKDILHKGDVGYGYLLAALQIGAFVMSFLLVARKPVERTGRALILTIIVYGFLTAAFGFSRIFALSLVLYGLVGAFDQISVIMRQTTIQLATPDELRGRVSAVNQVFVQSSNQVGAIESGFVAALAGATFAVVSGGVVSAMVASVIGWRMPLLYNYRVPKSEPHTIPDGAKPADTDEAAADRARPEAEETAFEEEALTGGA